MLSALSHHLMRRKREKRDRKLSMPRLILHSLQVNIRGGRLPEPENNGSRYLRIPLDALDAPWDGRREPPLMELAVTMRPSFGALTKYEIAVNLKTAKALGLTMPAHAACAWRRGDRIETTLLRLLTAAYGTKRTCQSCRSMSAFGGKADRCTALGGYPFP